MKKIYSKFTKDRKREFQIETYIAMSDCHRVVAKRSLNAEARAHIASMYQFYKEHDRSDLYCPSEMLGNDTICFDYLEGKSLCKEMLAALDCRDKDAFMGYLTHYHELLMNSVGLAHKLDPDGAQQSGEEASHEQAENLNPEQAHDPEQTGNPGPEQLLGEEKSTVPEITFKDVFGNVDLKGMELTQNLNIDLTFDNIIHVTDFDTIDGEITEKVTDHYQMIDYEWIFPFEVPVNYATYRAIYAFYLKYASAMKDVVTLQEMYDLFMMTAEDVALFEQMNASFDAYVYGAQGMHQISRKYQKAVYDVPAMIAEDQQYVQLFFDYGEGYSEAHSVNVPVVGQEVHLSIAVKNPQDVEQFRLDPLNTSCMLADVKLAVELSDGGHVVVQNFLHNAVLTPEGDYIYANEDPQICFANEWGRSVQAISISFRVLTRDVLTNPVVRYMAQKKKVRNLKQFLKLLKIYRK